MGDPMAPSEGDGNSEGEGTARGIASRDPEVALTAKNFARNSLSPGGRGLG